MVWVSSPVCVGYMVWVSTPVCVCRVHGVGVQPYVCRLHGVGVQACVGGLPAMMPYMGTARLMTWGGPLTIRDIKCQLNTSITVTNSM